MKQILIIIIILQAFVGYTQSSKVCNNFLGTDKNAWFTSSPTRYNDKLLYFSSTNFLTTKSEVTMHIVDTCGMGYKEVILPIKGINLGGVEIDDYGNILYFTEKYINDTTTYPVLLKFNLSGTVLLESKPVVFPYPSEKQPYTLEKVADGYIIGGFDTIYFDYSIGFVMKLDLQGNLIWFNKVFPLDYIPITSRLLPNGDIELLLVRSSALFIQNIYTVRYNKDGKFLSEKKSSTNTSSEEDYYSGYYKDGKWVIWGNTRFSYNYAQYHALMTILDEDLNIAKKLVFSPDTLNNFTNNFCTSVELRSNNELLINYSEEGKNSNTSKVIAGIYRYSLQNNTVKWKKEYLSKNVFGNTLSIFTDKNSIFLLQTVIDAFPGDGDSHTFFSKLSYTDGECIKTCSTSNIEDINSENISIFPNPGDNYITIKANELYQEGNTNVKIVDARGQMVYTEKLEQNTKINTENWSSGVYFISFINDFKGVIYTSKWIKF